MYESKMNLCVGIKMNNHRGVVEALKSLKNFSHYEFFDEKISFLSLAVLNNCTASIIEALINNGADVNRISFLDYMWPNEAQAFKSFEPALITATRHGTIILK